MSKREIKRLAIALIFLGASAGAGGLFFYLSRSTEMPTCFDAIKNQNEIGVDCGGSCGACQGKPEDLKLDYAALSAAENDKFDVVFKLSNPNTNFGALKLHYVADTVSPAGDILESRRGTTFVLPAGKDGTRWIVEHGMRGNAQVSIDIKIDDIEWIGTAFAFTPPNLFITDRVFRKIDSGPEFAEASGIVNNISPYNFDLIEVYILLFGKENDLLGARRTEMHTLKAGEKREFMVSWRTPLGDADKIEMAAYTNVFLNDNFVRDFGNQEKFQDLNPSIQ